MIQNNGLKTCSGCRKNLQLDSFYRNRSLADGLTNYCKTCFLQRTNTFESRTKRSERDSKRVRKLKNSLIYILGGVCVCCKQNDIDILEVDHKFDNGKEDRSSFTSNHGLYRFYLNDIRLARKVLQPLCANCNRKKQLIKLEFDRLERYGMVFC